jgi:hypothetical protein
MFRGGDELAYRPLIAPYLPGVIRHAADTVPGSIVRAGQPHHRRRGSLEDGLSRQCRVAHSSKVANRIVISYQGSWIRIGAGESNEYVAITATGQPAHCYQGGKSQATVKWVINQINLESSKAERTGNVLTAGPEAFRFLPPSG